jgi:uncharacterized protein
MTDARAPVNIRQRARSDGAVSNVRFDLPTPEGDTVEWWEAAREGRLLLRHCGDCGATTYYPRTFCPRCWSENVTWQQASGRGTLYTWSVIYSNDQPPFRDRVPYVAAIVELEEGPRMMTNVVDCDHDALRPDMPVELRFMEISEQYSLPVFTPVAAEVSR